MKEGRKESLKGNSKTKSGKYLYVQYLLYTLVAGAFVIIMWFAACNNKKADTNTINKNGDTVQLNGQKLARQYCASCHDYPQPALLDKKSWKQYILPRMGYMMGRYPHDSIRRNLIENGTGGQLVKKKGVFPKNPKIDSASWEAIQEYYIDHAPDSLTQPHTKDIQQGLRHFQARYPKYAYSPPGITLARFSKNGNIFIGDAHSKGFYMFNNKLVMTRKARIAESPVWVEEKNKHMLMTIMGSYAPTDNPQGFILKFPQKAGVRPEKIIDSLQRPVHTASADLNSNGREDIVVCEFAKWTGGLAWYENKGSNDYQKHVLSNKPGATKAYIKDLNDDQKPDIIALMSQGDEGIFAWYNQGKGNFKMEELISFPPAYGSSYFSFFDYNDDKHPDIIYTAGDNADFRPVLKPYHGIYIFANDGHNNFEQKFFYPLNGAYGAIPKDYDQDGDIDIAAISFFPDFKDHPQQSFVYLENQGNMKMRASTFEGVTKGRWIVMDAADYDHDQDQDLILGSLAFEVVPKTGIMQKWVNNGVPYVVLENTTK